MYSILGINKDADTCQLCGREELNRIVIVGDDKTHDIHGEYGTGCAAKVVAELNGWPRPTRITLTDAQRIENRRRRQVVEDLRAGHRDLKAGDLLNARWHAVEAARWNPLLRDDEKSAHAQLLTETESVAAELDAITARALQPHH